MKDLDKSLLKDLCAVACGLVEIIQYLDEQCKTLEKNSNG